MNDTYLIGFVIVVVAAALMLVFTLVGRKRPYRNFREIPAFSNLRRAIGLAVEDGSRLHISIGKANLISPQSASSLVGLTLADRIARMTLISDRPPIITAGDPLLALLSQDILRASYRNANNLENYDPARGRLTGLTPFSYAAGVLPIIREEHVSTNIFIGNFGNEIALLTDAAERQKSIITAASDSLSSQAIMSVATDNLLVGEELFATGAYLNAGGMHNASLRTQDVLRWLLVTVTVVGIILKVVLQP